MPNSQTWMECLHLCAELFFGLCYEHNSVPLGPIRDFISLGQASFYFYWKAPSVSRIGYATQNCPTMVVARTGRWSEEHEWAASERPPHCTPHASLPPSLQPKLSNLPWKQNGMIHRDRGEDWPRLVGGVSNRYDHLHHLLTSRWRHSGAVGAWIIVCLSFLPSLNLSSFLSDSLFPLRPPWAFGYFFSCSVGYCVGCSDAAIISVSAQFRWNLKSCTSCVPQLLEMSKFKFMVKLPHSLIKSVAGFAFGISIEIYFVLN